MEEVESTSPVKVEEKWRKADGTFVEGHPAFGNRPKGKTMKEYQAEKFRQMTDEEKEQWLIDNKVSPDLRWRMSEGNPAQDLTSGGDKIQQIPIYGGLSDISKHNSDQKDIQPDQENKGG